MSKIDKFWVVTKPSKNSELLDILFESDMKGMRLQFLGGLTSEELVGCYTDKSEAQKIAKKLIRDISK